MQFTWHPTQAKVSVQTTREEGKVIAYGAATFLVLLGIGYALRGK